METTAESNQPLDLLDPIKDGPLLASLKESFQNSDYMIIDEISMLDPVLLGKISQRLSNVMIDSTAFGGLNVLFVGDFSQIPPVKGSPIYRDMLIYSRVIELSNATELSSWIAQSSCCADIA